MFWPPGVTSFLETLLFSAVMGFSIFLSLPFLLSSGMGIMRLKLFNAVAIGILIFLVGDVFADAAATLYNGSLYGYGSSPSYDVWFGVSFAAGFLVLYFAENRSRKGLTPTRLAMLIALGISFQNLTEGLLFGSLGATMGLMGAAAVVLVGFIFQNVTEGFPITSPFFGEVQKRTGIVAALLLLGGFPTVFGGAAGYYYSSTVLDLVFEGLSIGAMLYVILPMLKNCFAMMDYAKQRMVYFGVFLGFLIGFIVNLI
jgi:zinc transporter, ZIP family